MDIRKELESRIIEPFAKTVSCDDGWLNLLTDLHIELVEIDPKYTIYQVKEKFGGLRFYYSPSSPSLDPELRKVVNKYESKSYYVCEKTGNPGSLKRKNGWIKTLNDSYNEDGWTDHHGDEPTIARLKLQGNMQSESEK